MRTGRTMILRIWPLILMLLIGSVEGCAQTQEDPKKSEPRQPSASASAVELEPVCEGRFKTWERRLPPHYSGPGWMSLLVPTQKNLNRFPLMSAYPAAAYAFWGLADNDLDRLYLEGSVENDMLWLPIPPCASIGGKPNFNYRCGAFRLSQIPRLTSLIPAMQAMDRYELEAHRDSLLVALKETANDFRVELARYERTPFHLEATVIAKEEDYSPRTRKLTGLDPADFLQVGFVSDVACSISLDQAAAFFRGGTGKEGHRVRWGLLSFTVLPVEGEAGAGVHTTMHRMKVLEAPTVVFDGPDGLSIVLEVLKGQVLPNEGQGKVPIRCSARPRAQ